MIASIILKEVTESLYSLKFRIVTILCASSMILSSAVLLREFERKSEDYVLNQPKSDEARVVIQPSVLSIYDSGLEKQMRRGYDIKPGTLFMIPSGSIFNPDFFSARFPIPDTAYLVRVVLSLLAMLLGFDLICGEKVKGTLRLVLSYGVPRTILALGKILGGFFILMVPFTFSFLLGLLLLISIGGIVFTSEELLRILVFYLGSALYLSIFLLLSIGISTRSKSPSASLVACLFIWAAFVFAIPSLSGTIVQALSPIPSSESIEQRKLLTYGFGVYDQKPANSNSVKDILELERQYRNNLNLYVDRVRRVSRLSPASSYAYFGSSLCQNGFEDEFRLKQQILQYRDLLLYEPNKARLVKFTFTPISFSSTLQNSFFDLVVLLTFLGVCFIAAFKSFMRYDIR
jgi:ABC-type transport system involved in multi-copper enzyme maturation permease subunit